MAFRHSIETNHKKLITGKVDIVFVKTVKQKTCLIDNEVNLKQVLLLVTFSEKPLRECEISKFVEDTWLSLNVV